MSEEMAAEAPRGLVDAILDLCQHGKKGSILVLGLLPLLLNQLDLALAGLDLGLASLTLRLENADAEKGGRREILEDGSHEVDKRVTERVLPRSRKELRKVAVVFGILQILE